MREAMTEAEIHRLGVHIVREELQQEGWIVLTINVNPKVNPQIIARKNGTLGHVLVRTARHPNRGTVENDHIIRWCAEHAMQNNAIAISPACGSAMPSRSGCTTRRPWASRSRAREFSSPIRAWRN